MALIERLPEFSDTELKTLHGNARRLIEHGQDKQREAAQSLMPALEAELEERKVRASEIRKQAAAARKAAKAPRKPVTH